MSPTNDVRAARRPWRRNRNDPTSRHDYFLPELLPADRRGDRSLSALRQWSVSASASATRPPPRWEPGPPRLSRWAEGRSPWSPVVTSTRRSNREGSRARRGVATDEFWALPGHCGDRPRGHGGRLPRLGTRRRTKKLPSKRCWSASRACSSGSARGRALGKIRHPGLIRIIATGHTSGLPWYAMELLRGQTLRERMRQGWPSEPSPSTISAPTTEGPALGPPADPTTAFETQNRRADR